MPHWWKKIRSHLAPGTLTVALLVLECFLFLSEYCHWFTFGTVKGWPVLFAIGSLVLAIVVIVLWLMASVCFHWPFRFGIRSLLLLCLAVTISFGWLVSETRRATRQSRAVVMIESLGGRIDYHEVDCEASPPLPIWMQKVIWDDGPIFVGQRGVAPSPPWMRRLLGEQFFAHTLPVRFFTIKYMGPNRPGTAVPRRLTDSELESLTARTEVRELYLKLDLNGAAVTDAGIAHLKELRHLEGLSLQGTAVTDEGLRHLSELKQLKKLDLAGTLVSRKGVEELREALPTCDILH